MADSAPNANALLDALTPGTCLTVDDFAKATGLPRGEISRVAGNLVIRDLIERTARGCFQLTPLGVAFLAGGGRITAGPKKGLTQRFRRRKGSTLRDRLWAALRIRGKATIDELLEMALADDETADRSYTNATTYLGALRRAGYLAELRREPGKVTNGCKRFSLVRDSGPEAPQYRIAKPARDGRPAVEAHVYDPNTREVHPLPTRAAVEVQP